MPWEKIVKKRRNYYAKKWRRIGYCFMRFTIIEGFYKAALQNIAPNAISRNYTSFCHKQSVSLHLELNMYVRASFELVGNNFHWKKSSGIWIRWIDVEGDHLLQLDHAFLVDVIIFLSRWRNRVRWLEKWSTLIKLIEKNWIPPLSTSGTWKNDQWNSLMSNF